VIPINMPLSGIDFLAFTGHKGLQGPTGTGGLILGERVNIAELKPLVRGGTGSKSEFEEQPVMLPDKYESGTPNSVGIAGLGAGVKWVLSQGVDCIHEHEAELKNRLIAGLMNIPNVKVYSPTDQTQMTAVISCGVNGKHVSDVGLALDDDYDILCRVGLHCAPSAHKTIGTFPEGTIRLALGCMTTAEDIQAVLRAFEKVAGPCG
jgi:selenocysteine lyase/cysteine desulfurase